MFGSASRKFLLIVAIPILALIVVVIVLNQRTGSESGSSQGQAGNTVAIGITAEPDTLDPQKTNAAVSALLLRRAGDTLIRKDLEGNYIPGLAESWEQSEDGKVWTFNLRRDVEFHDDTPFDAAAAKASIERAIDPETGAGVAGSLFSEVESVEATSEYTLEVTLERQFSVFKDNLTDPRAAIVNAEAAEEAGDEFERAPVLTGPWKITSRESGSRITMERNPDYEWGPGYAHDGPPYIQELVFRIMPDDATRVAALQANDIQITTVPPINVQQFKEAEGYRDYNYLRNGVGNFLEFNVQKAPFDDPLVREAMNYAVDKDAIVESSLRGLGQPACGPLPPSIDGYWSGICDYAPQYDPERAEQLLAEAGWEPGPDGVLTKDGEPFTFTLYSTPIDTWSQSAQLVQQQLEDIGIRMEIQNFEFGTLLAKTKAGEQQAHMQGYTYTNPDILYQWFHSSSIGDGLNLSHVNDPELDTMLEASRTEVDEEARNRIYREIQKYIVDKSLWVPLWVNEEHTVTQQQVDEAKISTEGYLSLLDARVEE